MQEVNEINNAPLIHIEDGGFLRPGFGRRVNGGQSAGIFLVGSSFELRARESGLADNRKQGAYAKFPVVRNGDRNSNPRCGSLHGYVAPTSSDLDKTMSLEDRADSLRKACVAYPTAISTWVT